jgi:hypothetical protein
MIALNPTFSAAFISGVMTLVLGLFGSPNWQIHDDAYYQMLAGGFGMVTQPQVDVPFMHPLIGQVIGMIYPLGGHFAYPAFLYLCIWAGGAAVAYRFEIAHNKAVAAVCLFAALAPIGLQLQYTTVSAFLVSCVAVLFTTTTAAPASLAAWIYGAALLLVAAMLRPEMAILAAVCLSPIVLFDSYANGRLNSALGKRTALSIVVLVGLYHIANIAFENPRMTSFYARLEPIVSTVDYQRAAMAAHVGSSLPNGISQNDLNLLNSWFFAESRIIEEATLEKLADGVSVRDRVRYGYWRLQGYARDLGSSIYFWFSCAALVLSVVSRYRVSVLTAVAIFVAADIIFSLFAKPFPQRVALGISVGIFLLAALTARPWTKNRRGIASVAMLAGILLLPAGLNIASDRVSVDQQLRHLAKDLEVLRDTSVLYAWAGTFPLRAAVQPFSSLDDALPTMTFLGTMYLLPAVVDGERDRGCGGFLPCLLSGNVVTLVAPDSKVDLLRTLLMERYGRTLRVLERVATQSFIVFNLAADGG